MHPLRSLTNRISFRRARRQAQRNGQVLCGTVDLDGRPLYFAVPADTPDEQIRDQAFELRHGRPMSDAERMLLDVATRRAEAQRDS